MPGPSGTNIELLGIGNALKSKRFLTPLRQRPFKWTDVEVRELLDDIDSALSEEETQYFMGAIVVIIAEDGSSVEVLDGQQRLATISLMMSRLADSLEDHGDTVRSIAIRADYLQRVDIDTADTLPQLKLNVQDEPYFRQLIDNGSGLPSADSPESHTLLYSANQLISKWLDDHVASRGSQENAINWLVALHAYLRDAVEIILVTVSDDANAYRIFETLNDRGLDLSITELLKNYLLGRSGDDLQSVLSLWDDAQGYLLAYGGEDTFRTFLRHYWSSRHEFAREKELYAIIKRRITSRSDSLDLARDLRENSYFYSAIISTDHEWWAAQSDEMVQRASILNALGLTQYRPLLLAALRTLNPTAISDLLRLLINWNVRLLVGEGLGSGPLEIAYAELGRAIRGGRLTSIQEISAEATRFVPQDDEFQSAFRTATVSKPVLARYYLRELELRAVGQSQPEVVPNSLPEQLNLEHVLPERPVDNWPNFTPEQVSNYRRRIGNLVLLTQKSNSQLRSAPFSEKREVYAESLLQLTKEVAKATIWNADEIARRQDYLSTLAVDAWPLT